MFDMRSSDLQQVNICTGAYPHICLSLSISIIVVTVEVSRETLRHIWRQSLKYLQQAFDPRDPFYYHGLTLISKLE